MNKWNLIVDVANCTNCQLCVLAVQDEHVGNEFPGYAAEMPKHGHRWIEIDRYERGQGDKVDVAYVPTMCQHCDDAPCIAAARDGAAYKRDDGIVVIDPDKAKGQRQIAEACPYDAVWWNEDLDIPQHWFFDAHLLDAGWHAPRCASVCPTGALRVEKVSDERMAEIARDEELEPLRPDLETRPRVHYRNLWRAKRAFVAGTVSGKVNGVIDCIEGATVTLTGGSNGSVMLETDGFGDFKFDRLPADGQSCTIQIAAAGFATAERSLTLSESTNLGDIRLERTG
ncbi:MAG: carboxypeptidase regulatory-like domain-containing protein [Alphaproteobacteria bacterium]|nr:carboxypeptidase regulatory-like domain-containing protein [Alphaproteobacteria bacterium]